MKLYEVPAGSKIRAIEKDAKELGLEVLKFYNVDGMYSYCTDSKGQVIHLAAWTEVEIVNDE